MQPAAIVNIRTIDCCNCGHWEEMPEDEPRHHSQTFKWLKNLGDNQAIYRCMICNSVTISEIMKKE